MNKWKKFKENNKKKAATKTNKPKLNLFRFVDAPETPEVQSHLEPSLISFVSLKFNSWKVKFSPFLVFLYATWILI